MSIAELGNGSWIMGILLILFGIIGLINAFAALIMWLKAFTEWLDKKATSRFWFCFAIIIVTFGWYALFKLIKLL
jgi:sulfite exporter TauE/SafE